MSENRIDISWIFRKKVVKINKYTEAIDFISMENGMKLRMIFLGTGSAFTVGTGNYQSNVLLELDGDTLLIDAGTDLRHSIYEQNLSYLDIKNVFISHLHNDHCGGLEWLALNSYFDPRYIGKPNLFLSEHIVSDLWNKTLAGLLLTLEPIEAELETYFNVASIKDGHRFVWNKISFELIKTTHYCSNHQLMPTYGLFFNHNHQNILYTADTQFTPDELMHLYEKADIIFHDCELLPKKTTVHAHYSDLVTLPEHIKRKMWLYHYNPITLPDAKEDGFLGFVTKGQVFEF